MDEVALEQPKNLDELNGRLDVWLSECYQHKAHSALHDHVSPSTAFRSDAKALRFVNPETLAHAFLHCESRKVDKSGCISFMSQKYEAGLSFIGCKVDVVYDPADVTELTIEYEGHTPWKARQLVIGERAGQRPKMPEHLGKQPTEHSRLLNAAKEQYEARQEQVLPAVSYRKGKKGDTHHV